MHSSQQLFFQRVGLPIGLQLYALGDDAGRDLDATFAQLAEIGYRDVELPSLYGQAPRAINAAAQRAGLAISCLHLPPMAGAGLSLLSEASAIAEAVHGLGAQSVVLPILLFPPGMQFRPGENFATAISRAATAAGEDVWKRTAALLNEKGAALKPLGVGLSYHNHNLEFAPVGGTTGWDILVRETDPALVGFEVDTGWVAAAGLEVTPFLERIAGRVTHLHVKDIRADGAPNFQLEMSPSEVGAGVLDWRTILPAAYAAGARHFYVEQEPPFTIPRIEAARRSYAFLGGLRA